ncbi:unnamed protein product, partial [Rotaria sp. Silwood2]
MAPHRLGSAKYPIILSDDDDDDFVTVGGKAGKGRVGNNRAGASNADNNRPTTNQVDVVRIPKVRIALNVGRSGRHVIRRAGTSQVVTAAVRTKRAYRKRARQGRPAVNLDETFVCEARISTPRNYPTRAAARQAAAINQAKFKKP